MIDKTTVDAIIEAAKIEDVVGEFVNLKRRGVNLIGLCPFHNEKTPSFTVSTTKNIAKCFGCGKGGTPVQFLMEHENLTFPEALHYLAKKYNIEIKEKAFSVEERMAQQMQESLHLVNQYAVDFYRQQLFQTAEGKHIGLSYFKERGFNEQTVKKFDLGFAPTTPDAFTKSAVKAGYQIEVLKKLGLTSQFDRDFFRERVLFTIHNLSGKPIAFAGRTLKKDKKIPKYINSPETDVYVKNKVLYGISFAKQAIRKEEECILVEGYTDVISLSQAGVENVVASSGTSLTVGQIQLIKRYTQNIKILYDGDAAGVKAALRGLDLVLEQDMNVKIVLLPNGEDPDSYIQKVGVTQFRQYAQEEAKDFIFFKTNLLLEEAANDPIKKSLLIKDLIETVSKIPDGIKRAVYVKQCSDLMEIEEAVLHAEVNRLLSKTHQKSKSEASIPHEAARTATPIKLRKEGQKGTHEFQERDIVRILITGGATIFKKEKELSVKHRTVAQFILENIEDVIENFDDSLYKLIVKETRQRLKSGESVDSNFFLYHEHPEIRQLALDLTSPPYEYSAGWEEREIFLNTQKMPEQNFTNDSEQGVKRFKLHKIMRMCVENQKRIQTESDSDKLMTLLRVQQKLLTIRNSLAKELNTVILD